MTASHPQYFIVIDSISPHSNSQLLTAIHCDEPNTGFEPRLISAHFFCPLVWLAVTFFGMLFWVLVKRILTNMLKLWYNRQNTKEKFLDFGAIVGE